MTSSARHKRLRSLVAVGAVMAAVTALTAGTAAAATTRQSAPTDPDGYYLVRDTRTGPADLGRALQQRGYDVLEGRADRGVPILAGPQEVTRLRAEGMTVTFTGPLYNPVAPSLRAAPGTYYGGYHTVAGHEAHDQAVATAHPDLVKLYAIGQSWRKTQGTGGHDIQALCITRIQAGDCELTSTNRKPKFVLMAQMHARELSTGELAYMWIDNLVGNYGRNADVTALMDTTETWVIPIANPDGVDIVSSNSTRPVLQRKNAHTNGCSGTSIGVDLNRNSEYHWDKNQGTTCSETYPGPRPKSEPETQGIEDFLARIYRDTKPVSDNAPATQDTTGVFITLHSYASLNIYPYGWTNRLAPNNNDLKAIADRMAAANQYEVVHGDGGLNYFAPGATDDWIYGALGVPGYAVEVGPSGGRCSGFLPAYSCMAGFWSLNAPAFLAAARSAAKPYPTGH